MFYLAEPCEMPLSCKSALVNLFPPDASKDHEQLGTWTGSKMNSGSGRICILSELVRLHLESNRIMS